MPPGSLLRVALFALLAAALSGCVSGQAPTSAPTSSQIEEGTGRWVGGTVVDEELLPVSGAQVREQGAPHGAQTDGSGRFRLDNVSAKAEVALEASHPMFRAATLRVDLLYVRNAEVRFVLTRLPTEEPHHLTNTTVGEITCQIAFGSHHGFPGFYRQTCADALSQSKERIQVPVEPGVVAGIIELSWEPQSQFADIMGMTVYLSTQVDEFMLAAVHSLPQEHYIGVYTGTSPMANAKARGGQFDTFVHVDPGVVDEHVPTNAGVVVQQEFTLYTTAFYGQAPPPTWSALKAA